MISAKNPQPIKFTFPDGVLLIIHGETTQRELLNNAALTAVNEKNYRDPSAVLCTLEKKLPANFASNHGLEIAVVFVNGDEEITFAGADTHLLTCDGDFMVTLKGQKIRFGIGAIKDKKDVEATTAPLMDNEKYFIISAALHLPRADQPALFATLKEIILTHHYNSLEEIMRKLTEFLAGEKLGDEFILVSMMNDREE